MYRLLYFWLLLIAVGNLLGLSPGLSPSPGLLDGVTINIYIDSGRREC
jgi:hypothetical protein